jgi:alpha-L-fucosidase
MKKIILLCCLLSFGVSAQNESKTQHDARMAWWRDATFGLFIHWGLYSVPAGEYQGKQLNSTTAEWIMQVAKIPIPEYETYTKTFNPTKFDATAWVKMAKDAGVKYIVITSKHHEGFALWDSKVSNYDIVDASSFKRDILAELSDACKLAGIKMCFYYSIMDWHEPNAESKKEYPHQNTVNPDWDKYRETYMKPQLKELVTKYQPAVLWFDGEWIPEWTEPQGKELYAWLRSMNPNMIINNRVGKGRKGMNGMNAYHDAAGDFGTPEQEILEGTADSDWESCMTMNDTWGFNKNDKNWKSSTTLIHNLIDVAAKGGNYLLNVGPTAEGLIPEASIERLAEMGNWLKINGEAIYATNSLKQYKEGENIKFTTSKNKKIVYAFILKKDENDLIISSIKPKKGSKMIMLGVNEPLSYTSNEDGSIKIHLPNNLPFQQASVIKIKVK